MNIRDTIIYNTIYEASINSLHKIKTIEIARNSGCSEANIFKLFNNKCNLLLESYLNAMRIMENEISINYPKNIKSMDRLISFTTELWNQYIYFFVSKQHFASFVYEYRLSYFYSSSIARYETRIESPIIMFLDSINETFSIYKILPRELFINFVINSALGFAKKIIDGEFEDDAEKVEEMYQIVFGGIINRLKETNSKKTED